MQLQVFHLMQLRPYCCGMQAQRFKIQPDLYKAQVSALGRKIHKRLQTDEWARSSGCIVNTNGWIQEEGYRLLLHTIQAMSITVVLVMGHDRLYSMLRSAVGKGEATAAVKVIKVPRSGGGVSRDASFLRQSRSRSLKRYFYGDMIDAPSKESPHRVPQLTPFLLQINLTSVSIYKYSAMSLSASLLPVAAARTTESVQLTRVDPTEQLQHAVLAVCHPHAVAAYEQSGRAADLYEAGVAGFCAVERVILETDRLHLLSPCAGSLPCQTLLLGDITWME